MAAPAFVTELVLSCSCGAEAIRSRKVGTPAEIATWAQAWREGRSGIRLVECRACGAELVLELDAKADVAVRDLEGRLARDATKKTVRVRHGVRLRKKGRGRKRSAPPATNTPEEGST